MADPLGTASVPRVSIHLLDSAQGHPIQTWNFHEQPSLTIGRGEDNDITIADPHVSRAHAKLVREPGGWKLVSTGRHGTLVKDQLVSEIRLHHQDIFQLGTSGPSLRFDTEFASNSHGETMDSIDHELLNMFAIDEEKKREEVDQIAGDTLFQSLQEQSQRFKAVRDRSEKDKS